MFKYINLSLLVVFLLEFYVYQAVKSLSGSTKVRVLYWAVTLLAYAVIGYFIWTFSRSEGNHHKIQWMMGLLCIFVLPKIFICLFLVVDDALRLFQYLVGFLNKDLHYFPERRKFMSRMALGMGGLVAVLMTDGIVFGKYRHWVRRLRLKLNGLPSEFKNYKIVQISDVHSGSFFHPEKLQKAIDLINEQNPDLVLFTGDMVNNYAKEFEGFVDLFSQIKAKDGKFSVLGNHDYGYYGEWKNKAEQQQNIPNLIELQQKCGFKMLMNQHVAIERNGKKIYIVGVENWGIKPFPQFGDLDKATENIPNEAIKILMSHDPSHFDAIVKKHPSHIHLTLSGHTHGMQFGLDLKNFKWSPVQYKYPKWMDLYESENKYLYVNRGFGVLAYPGRVGINPEITLIELH